MSKTVATNPLILLKERKANGSCERKAKSTVYDDHF